MLRMSLGVLQDRVQQYSTVLIAAAFALSGVMPIILTSSASAATFTSRKVTISNSTAGQAAVDYAFSFNTTGASVAIQSLIFTFCTTPQGACTLPQAMEVSHTNTSIGTAFSGTEATAFTENTTGDSNLCTTSDGGAGTATQYCLTRTETNVEVAGTKTITLSGIKNPTIASGNNTSVYVRVAAYSDAAYTTLVHDGVVAASIVNQLTVTGRVQERLVFCVFALDDADGSATAGSGAADLPTSCAAASANEGTSVDIGVVDNSSIAVSPVDNSPPTATGNDRFGAAIVNTNASNGVALTYFASQAGSGTDELRAFRVSGATCTNGGASVTDQCFVSASNTGEDVTAGTERFGMQLACVVDSSTSAVGTTANLGLGGAGSGSSGTFNDDYESDTATGIDDTASDNCENRVTTDTDFNHFAWNDTGTADPLISSTTVVDDEMVKLRYGATASATTPTGTYTVSSTYIATPTF
jgi:hypothetical protein